MIKQQIAKWREKIEKSNAAFEEMSRREKRVQIAKDVIAAIRTEVLRASHQGYLHASTKESMYFLEHDPVLSADAELQDVLSDKQCTVCAIGSVFVAAVTRCDDLTVQDAVPMYCVSTPRLNHISKDVMTDYLAGIFSRDELDRIENAYEGFGRYRTVNEEMSKYPGKNSNTRLINIMKNIIRNEGDFKPMQDIR